MAVAKKPSLKQRVARAERLLAEIGDSLSTNRELRAEMRRLKWKMREARAASPKKIA